MSEYEMLREEMMQCYNSITSYNVVLYTATAGILTFTLRRQEYYLCLLPIVVIVPLFLLCEQKNKTICYIASYMYVFLEGKDFNWERRHHKYDMVYRKKGSRWWIAPHYLLVIICCSLAIVKLITRRDENGILIPLQITEYSIIIAIIAFCCIILLVLKKNAIEYKNKRKEFIKQWRYMIMHRLVK